MRDNLPAAPAGRPAASSGPRIIGLTAAAAGVLVLAAAAFRLSYPGVHAIARQAGVAASLARIYPPAIDALLVVAGAAVLSLRGAGLAARGYAWLSLLVLLAAAAGADSLHAAGTRIPHRASEIAAAIIPWVMLLAGFGLLVVMLRHGRPRRSAAPATAQPAGAASAAIAALTAPTVTHTAPADGGRAAGLVAAGSAAAETGSSGTGATVPLPSAAASPSTALSDTASSSAPPASEAQAAERPWVPWTTHPAPPGQSAEDDDDPAGQDDSLARAPLAAEPLSLAERPGQDTAAPEEVSAGDAAEPAGDGGGPDAGAPPSFDRMRSLPTPPAG